LKNLDNYVSLITLFDYSDSAFESYKEVYEAALDDAKKGAISASVKKVIEDRSLISRRWTMQKKAQSAPP